MSSSEKARTGSASRVLLALSSTVVDSTEKPSPGHVGHGFLLAVQGLHFSAGLRRSTGNSFSRNALLTTPRHQRQNRGAAL